MMIDTEHGVYLCWVGQYTDLRDKFSSHICLVSKLENAWSYSLLSGHEYKTFLGKDNTMYIKSNPTTGLVTVGFHEETACK